MSEGKQQEPYLYAVESVDGEWMDGENCVFSDRASAQDEVDSLNDNQSSPIFRLVPLYRAAQPAHQPAAAPVAGAPYDRLSVTSEQLERTRKQINAILKTPVDGVVTNVGVLKFLLDYHDRSQAAALTPSPVAPPPIDISSDFCPRCHKFVMREGQFYGINPDAVCKCQEAVAPVATEETQRLRELLREKIILMGLNHNKKFNGDLHEPDSCTICDVLRAEAALGQLPEGK